MTKFSKMIIPALILGLIINVLIIISLKLIQKIFNVAKIPTKKSYLAEFFIKKEDDNRSEKVGCGVTFIRSKFGLALCLLLGGIPFYILNNFVHFDSNQGFANGKVATAILVISGFTIFFAINIYIDKKMDKKNKHNYKKH